MPEALPKNICSSCVLPDTYPGISFDSENVCNFCREARAGKSVEVQRSTLKQQLDYAIESHRGKSTYDCVVAFSGGKDSSYTLYTLVKNYGLRCLALTVDNGFLAPKAKENCLRVADALKVDHIFFRPAPQFMDNLYRTSATDSNLHSKAALRRASSICNSCIKLINNQVLRTAVEKGIAMIAGGYIAGQVPKDAAALNLSLDTQVRFKNEESKKFESLLGPEAKAHYSFADIGALATGRSVMIINPMLTILISEEQIIETIGTLGWEMTANTGRNSTNCQLNDLAIHIHHKQFGFNPYVFEIAEEVRAGTMSREKALRKTYQLPEKSEISVQAKRLGLENEI